jgi:raffinose/stachyose/melibiose transport system substrate-binding protein
MSPDRNRRKKLGRPAATNIALALAVMLVVGAAVLAASPAPAQETVALTMGSWRTDDIRQMNALFSAFNRVHPDIRVTFDPTPAPEYNEVLDAQLEGGSAPDLFYLRSFGTSRRLYEKGYLAPLADLPGIQNQFTAATRAPWSTDDGRPYGVPFIATSHGVYYNQDAFKRLGLDIPSTWEAFLETAEKIKAAGLIPLANASGDGWTINEIVFFNLAPNFIGGREGRMAYLKGERCFNDGRMISAFGALRDLAPYLPKNQTLLRYTDSLQLFLQGKAVMWLGGSWDIPFFEASRPAFEWSVFAPPPPAGQPPFITFHLDAGMGLNAASPRKKAAKTFLAWMTTPEFGALLGNELPGFFPLHKNVPKLVNAHAQAFLALNQGRGTDVRLAWEKLRDGEPDGYMLTQNAAVAVVNGTMTPGQAADSLQHGLEQWFEPARKCSRP